jgi:hypothetical protein
MASKPIAKAKEILVDEEIATQEHTEVVEKVTPVKKEPQKPKWEIKDRTYTIADSHGSLTYTLQSRHSVRYPLVWFNAETGEQEELRYATNQNSPLVSEQKGQSTLGHIIFENGVLNVPKEKQNLQKLLSIYHPALNKTIFIIKNYYIYYILIIIFHFILSFVLFFSAYSINAVVVS